VAVYDRSYRAYEGPITPRARRFFVITRHALVDAFRSKLVTLTFTTAFLPLIGAALWMYLHHNVRALAALKLASEALPPIDAVFFLAVMSWQSFLFGGVLTLLIGPALISADLSNGALPLFLSRPLSKWGYLAGKLAVLAILLSAVTWIPGLLLFGLGVILEDWSWTVEHARIPLAIFLGCGVWIAVLSLLALATSALARKRVAAQGLLAGTILGGAWIGAAINEVFDVPWGHVLNIPEVMRALLGALYAVPLASPLPTAGAAVAIPAICAACAGVLALRLKAKEVVR
jgi:ABC-2 type transport system permease protein